MSIKYLTKEQILLLHSIIIDETSGIHGIRDITVILSLEYMPQQHAFGVKLYSTIFLKAAVYMRTIAMNHPFIDGNKRTGAIAGAVFLENNGYIMCARQGAFEQFAIKIVQEKLPLEKITDWFRKYSKKRS